MEVELDIQVYQKSWINTLSNTAFGDILETKHADDGKSDSLT